MAEKTILVTGATGLLGPYLMEALASLGEVVGAGHRNGRYRCDLGVADAVEGLFREVDPEIVIHAAAGTSVDGCEEDPKSADAINHLSARWLAERLPPHGKLVYISTDQVYPNVAGPHREGTEFPVNVYGRTKLAGERAAACHQGTLVLRTNFFGPSRTEGRNSFSDWLISAFRGGEKITMFSDVFFSPLHIQTLSELIARCLREELSGLYNLGSRNGMSKANFGLAVAKQLGLSTENAVIGTSNTVPLRARRPLDLRMTVDRIESALQTTMPTLEQEISKL